MEAPAFMRGKQRFSVAGNDARREATTFRAVSPARAFSFGSLFSYNHVTNSGFQYDAAGNMTHDASHSYTYDAENHITKVDGGSTATYTYDANGRRVQTSVGGVVTDYVYDLAGHVMSTYPGGCGVSCRYTQYIYLNGALTAEYTWNATYFAHTDHLGSTRLLTGYPTASVVECDDYYPFGESIGCGGTSTTTHKFTGYERDSETGLDNAQARYNSSAMGRFMSPDPAGIFVADAANPQSWNLYTYAGNNPLRMIDPSGLDGLDYYDCLGSGGGNACGGNPELASWEDFSSAWGTSYTMDGAAVPAGVAQSALDSGSAEQCPNNACSGFGTDANGNTAWVQFYAFAGGVSGYFNPGDLANGINEVNGQLLNDANYNLYLQRTYAAQIAAQLNRLNGNLAADFPGQGISANPDNPNIVGGHANFGLICAGSCPEMGRYDNGVHIPEVGIAHNDTVSPWTGPFSFSTLFSTSFWEHGFVDLIGGQFVPVFSH